MKHVLFFVLVLVMVPVLSAQDAATSNPTKYKPILENERVRVLAPFKWRLTLGDVKTVIIEMKAGDSRFIQPRRTSARTSETPILT